MGTICLSISFACLITFIPTSIANFYANKSAKDIFQWFFVVQALGLILFLVSIISYEEALMNKTVRYHKVTVVYREAGIALDTGEIVKLNEKFDLNFQSGDLIEVWYLGDSSFGPSFKNKTIIRVKK